MSFWIRFAINTALGAVASLVQQASTTPEHKAKLSAFVQAGNDLLNGW